ncbi:MAG: dATP/dGTP diphosphohydrolase domain-containing protein [Planctomycetaceae bacterium]
MPIPCARYRIEFEPADSVGSDFQLCQDCWERDSSRLWWSMIAALAPPEDTDLMTEHDLPRIFNPDGPAENPKDRVGAGKPPLHLIPPAAEILEAVVMGLGARKYGEFNWRTSKVRATVYIAAAKRHLAQWLDGQDDDPESGVSHLAHARACLGVLLDAIATGNVIDDRPNAGPAAELIQKHTKAVSLTSPPQLR